MQAPLKWLFQDAEGDLFQVLADDKSSALSLSPSDSRLLDSRFLFEESWNLEAKDADPAPYSRGRMNQTPRPDLGLAAPRRIREPRLSDGNVHSVSYRRMTVAER